MDKIRMLLSRCASFFRKKKLEADLDDELSAHLDLAVHENLQRGMSQSEARTASHLVHNHRHSPDNHVAQRFVPVYL
jgi:hypothetical protein